MPPRPMTGPGLRRGPSSRPRVLAILLVASALLFTFSVRGGDTGPIGAVKGVVQAVCMPVRYVGSLVCSPFAGLSNLAANLTAEQGTLSDLKAENEQLKAENAKLKESELEATRLEGLLELQNTYGLKSTGARVISGSVDSLTTTITIDKGSSSGLAVGMPVTDTLGVIGQISSVGPATAQVRLITDERSGVSSMVQESRAQGQLVGQGTDMLRLTLVRTDQAVDVGDLVVTSGLGGVYPKGLLLGTVSSVDRPTGALYYEILVTPAAQVSNLEEVLVITSLTEDQKATVDEAKAADDQQAGLAPSTSGSADGSQSSDGSSAVDGPGGGNAESGATGSSGDGDASTDGASNEGAAENGPTAGDAGDGSAREGDGA